MLAASIPPMTDDHEKDVTVAATVTDLFADSGKHHAGKIQLAAEPAPPGLPQEVFRPMRIAELKEHDRVVMYGTIVTITGDPYVHTPLEGTCELQPGWVHVPMIWDGWARSTGERADDLVAVSRRVFA